MNQAEIETLQGRIREERENIDTLLDLMHEKVRELGALNAQVEIAQARLEVLEQS